MTTHNHFTRDIKPQGQCPSCDEYHLKTKNESRKLDTASESLRRDDLKEFDEWQRKYLPPVFFNGNTQHQRDAYLAALAAERKRSEVLVEALEYIIDMPNNKRTWSHENAAMAALKQYRGGE